MKETKRRKRKNGFFSAVLILLIIKVMFAKFDIFGASGLMTGFCDVLIIILASCIISSLPTKGRLLAYSLFSFILGLIIVAFKSRTSSLQSLLSITTPLYFLDTVFVFLIFLLVRNLKSKRKEVIPKHPRSVYAILALFAALTIFNIFTVKMTNASALDQARKLGIFAYSAANPTMYIRAENLPSTAKSGGTNIVSKTPTAAPTPTIDPNLPKYYGLAKNKNVIVIQWEALQDLGINRSLNGVEITPNLNQFLRESIYFKNGISQISMGTTSDAEFAVNTSCYPLPAESAFKTMADRDFAGLPKLLKAGGYYTTTFHTNTATFWNRKNMYPALGFDKWYDSQFFGADLKGKAYGTPDYYLFKKAVPELTKLKTPFYAQFITVTSHSPFRVPDWMRTVDLGSQANSCIVGKYLKNINYTDRQFGMFMKDLKASGLYDDSLIIIYGDHYGINPEKIMKYDKVNKTRNYEVLKQVLGRDFDELDPLNVPIAFKLPGGANPAVQTMPAAHVDILPTLLNLTGLENKIGTMFGKDLFNTGKNLFGVRFYAPAGSFVDNERMYFGTEFSIDFATHTKSTTAVNQSEQAAVQAAKDNSDAYVRALPTR